MTQPKSSAPQGTLIVVGTGIKLVSHVTQAAQQAIAQAEVVLFVAGDALVATWITRLNPAAESLHVLYAPGKRRRQTYREMTARILAEVRQGRQVCAAFYGHPGVFVRPAHAAIRQARREGFPAGMLPGISAEDCLFADLEVTPSRPGGSATKPPTSCSSSASSTPPATSSCGKLASLASATSRPTTKPAGPDCAN